MITVSYTLSYYLRYEFDLTDNTWDIYSFTLPVVLVIQLTTMSLHGIYRNIWRYVGIPNLLKILKSITISFILIFIYFALIVDSTDYSRTLLLINMLLTTLLLSGSRLFYRLTMEFFTEQSDKKLLKNALIIGSGDAGNEILRSIMNNAKLNYNVVGFIDDDPRNKDLSILGIPILGSQDDLLRIVTKKDIDEVIISIQNATDEQMRRIISTCKKAKVPFRNAKWTLGDT